MYVLCAVHTYYAMGNLCIHSNSLYYKDISALRYCSELRLRVTTTYIHGPDVCSHSELNSFSSPPHLTKSLTAHIAIITIDDCAPSSERSLLTIHYTVYPSQRSSSPYKLLLLKTRAEVCLPRAPPRLPHSPLQRHPCSSSSTFFGRWLAA
jgi:hypothetical protein